MEVRIARQAGYCYGVERALRLAEEAASAEPKPVWTLGPIIHNPQVVEDFVARGVRPVTSLGEIESGTVIIRTHGVGPAVVAEAGARGLTVIDATCPFVGKAQRRAAQVVHDGYQLVIVGERDHPEVAGILAHAGGAAIVAESLADLGSLSRRSRLGVVVQTTQPVEHFQQIVGFLAARHPELKVFNTICNETARRQAAARQLAEAADVMIVVGGKNSANTSRLAQICRATGSVTHHIETGAEIEIAWLNRATVVGLTSGASTPESLLRAVVARVERLARSVTAR